MRILAWLTTVALTVLGPASYAEPSPDDQATADFSFAEDDAIDDVSVAIEGYDGPRAALRSGDIHWYRLVIDRDAPVPFLRAKVKVTRVLGPHHPLMQAFGITVRGNAETEVFVRNRRPQVISLGHDGPCDGAWKRVNRRLDTIAFQLPLACLYEPVEWGRINLFVTTIHGTPVHHDADAVDKTRRTRELPLTPLDQPAP